MSASGCESIRPLISAFMDGELSPDESRRLREHLDSCSACRELFDDYRLVRDQMRQLPPDPQPPEDIAHVVWEHARRQQGRSGVARWIGMSGARLSLSVAAALAILVIASAFLLVRGYQQGVPPGIAASQPARASIGRLPTWPMTQAVRITFTKPMNHQSVQDNLKIIPSTEGARLPMSWEGNTLVIGVSPTTAKNLQSDTDYTIAILPQATDIYGHALGGSGFELKFHTTSSRAASTSTPAGTRTPLANAATSFATPSPTSQDAQQSRTAVVPSSTTAPSATEERGTAQANIGTQAGDGTATTSPSVTVDSTKQSTKPSSGAGTTPTSTDTSTVTATPPSQPTPTPSPTPRSTLSPTPVPTRTSTPTETASPTEVANAATPTGTAAPGSATPTSTPSPIPVTGAFGSVYWADQSVQGKLGAPDPRGQYTIIAEQLPFQKGLMYDSRDQSSTIYVLINDGNSYTATQDTWQKSDKDPTSPTPPSSNPPLYIPLGNFGKVWQDQNLSDSIGFAVSDPAKVAPESVPIQQFAHGLMLYDNQGFVYVLYNDNTWQVYPDTSGHGDLLPTPTTTATPSGSSTATATPTVTPQPPTPTTTPDTTGSGENSSVATPTVTPTP